MPGSPGPYYADHDGLPHGCSEVFMPCSRIGLVVHEGRPTALRAADVVRDWAARREIPITQLDVWSSEDHRRSAADEVAVAGHPDLVVTIGGDGTFLRGVRVAVQDDAPVLGVDVGRVGFLTEISPEEVGTALDTYAAGEALVEERLMVGMRSSRPLTVPPGIEALLRYGRGPIPPPPPFEQDDPVAAPGDGYDVDVTAMNDIVFEKLVRHHQASIGVYVDGQLFASYSADAVIVASPTGSTAYSFSAGGPVLSPRLRALICTPVAPHMVFNRSLVVPADEQVEMRVLESSGPVVVSVDGQIQGVLEPGDWVDVDAGTTPARLVRLRPSRFYDRLRERFGLGPAPATAGEDIPTAIDLRQG